MVAAFLILAAFLVFFIFLCALVPTLAFILCFALAAAFALGFAAVICATGATGIAGCATAAGATGATIGFTAGAIVTGPATGEGATACAKALADAKPMSTVESSFFIVRDLQVRIS